MLCTGCGKDIPFHGQVCPFCQRDKQSDQTGTVLVGAAMIFGGFIGNLVAGFMGMVVGGLVLGFIAGIAIAANGNHSAKKPPRVRIDRLPEPRAGAETRPSPTPSAADRLRQLEELRSQGLVNEAEYENQRNAIIASV